MTCPKCGLQTNSEQKFCRSCGASLQLITQPLAEHPSVPDPQKAPANIFGNRRGSNFALWGFTIMFLGVAIGVIGKKLMHDDIVTVIGVLLSLVGMFLTVYPVLSPARLRAPQSGPNSRPEELTPSKSAGYLAAGNATEYVPAITERTTDLLENSTATKQRHGGDKN